MSGEYCSTPGSSRGRPAICPRMEFEPSLPFRPAIAEKSARPPALEISAAPHAYFFHMRQFERPIYPAAATPARRPDVPVRMVVERDNYEWLGYLADPKGGEMMEIPGPVEDERRQRLLRFAVKFLGQTRRR